MLICYCNFDIFAGLKVLIRSSALPAWQMNIYIAPLSSRKKPNRSLNQSCPSPPPPLLEAWFMIAYWSEIAIKKMVIARFFFFSGPDVCLLKTLLGRQCLPANTSRNEFKRENGIDPWIKLIYGLLYAIHLHPNPSRLHLLWRIEWPLDFTKKLVIISFHKISP